jgi:UDP-N-acetylglucosamine 4-epimerase
MSEVFHNEDLSGKRFLVTGGAGFIGSHIAEYLLRNGAGYVRVLDNLSNGFQKNIDLLKHYPSFEFIEGDIRDLEICKKACEGIDYVSHQAALGSVPRSIKEPVYFTEVNIVGFANVLQAAVEKKVKRLVYASSSSVYGDESSLPKKEALVGKCLSPYAATKKTNELYAQVFADVYGLELMGFRYFNIFGPRQDPDGAYAAVIPLFVKSIINRLPVYINGDGEQTRDFTYVDNAVQVNIKGMLTENRDALNKIYNVAVGENFSVNYLYEACREHLNSDWKVIHREPRAGDIRDSLADISLARKMLGYQPSTKFKEGLAETIEYFRKIYSGK